MIKFNGVICVDEKYEIYRHSYSFEFKVNDGLINFRNCIPLSTLEEKNDELIEILKCQFEIEIRKFLNLENV